MNNFDLQNDIKENRIFEISKDLLEILLIDRTTKKNIIWATNNYANKGIGYFFNDNISIYNITGRNGKIIKPRIEKSQREQSKRVKEKAEVFTPSWICNCQNNLIDEAWFGRKDVFNIEEQKTWEVVRDKIAFPTDKTWEDYIKDTRLEITCGEAPYLVSRYDTVTGESIAVENRIGLLDRKLRVISENINIKEDWIFWAKIAYKNVYGYDWQGDNVLLARENLLLTFIDYYKAIFDIEPPIKEILEIAEIISWNIWQMDGLKFVIPNSCQKQKPAQLSLFDDELAEEECPGCKKNQPLNHNGIYCKIMNWETNRAIKFVSLLKGRK